MPTSLEPTLLPDVQHFLSGAEKEFSQIPEERKRELEKLSAYVQQKVDAGAVTKLIFICTHNSRRSHMSQIWAQVAAAYYGIPRVEAYSGGTEATAFNPRAVKAMRASGLDIQVKQAGENPIYVVNYAQDAAPLEVWSKKYDDTANPSQEFAAIMTCSHADEHCPFIPGATKRLPIRYNDPKEYDGSPLEEEKYNERARQIAREMLYAFSKVKQNAVSKASQ